MTGPSALERLAKTYPGHRQVIVNALCAYLQVSPASIWAEAACTRGEFMLADFRNTIRDQLQQERAMRRLIDQLRKATYVSVRI